MARSRIEQVLFSVQEKITERIPSCSFALGAQFVAEQNLSAPRVVWVRGVDRYSAADRPAKNPRALLTKETAILAHCWAIGDGDPANPSDPQPTPDKAIEDLQDTVAWALRTTLGIPANVMQGEHLRDSVNGAGRVCVLAFSLAQPVNDDELPTVTIASIAPDASDAVANDGSLDCGSST